MRADRRSWPLAAFWDARHGTAALEFGLVAPILFLILAGAVSFGIALRMKMEVGAGARAGAAYASAYGFDSAKITAAAKNATALTNLTVNATQATASCTNAVTGAITAAPGPLCPNLAAPGTYVTVTTQMSYTFILPPPGMAKTTTLYGKAVARIQ